MLSKIEISYKTFIFVAILVASIWFFVQILDIVLLLFISFIIMSALRPLVELLVKWKIPRVIAILLLYILLLGAIAGVLAGVIPAVATQTTHLVQTLPGTIERVAPTLNFNINDFTQQITPISQNLVKVTVGIFSNVFSVITILVFAFYFLLERKNTEQTLAQIIGKEKAENFMTVLVKIEDRMGYWVQGQLVLMLVIGVFSYIGLLILRIEYALPLAILAGLLEIVPTIGPIISAIPAILVAIATSPIQALTVVILYIIIHQTENGLIVPFVMKKSVGMPPVLTIISLMVGARLAGILGAVLSVPIVLIIQELTRLYFSKKES